MQIGAGFPGAAQGLTVVGTTAGPSLSTTGAYATIPEMDATINNLTPGSLLVAIMNGGFYHGTVAVQTHFALSLDGALETDDIPWNVTGSNLVFGVTLMGMWTVSLTSHNVKGRWLTGTAGLTAFGTNRKLRLIELRTG